MTFEELKTRLQDFNNVKANEWHQHPNGGGWVQNTATVTEGAYVNKTAIVRHYAKVLDNAHIGDYAIISYGACVRDRAKVYGMAKIEGEAEIYGYAHVFDGANVSENAQIFDSARVINNAVVERNAKVYGTAVIYGNSKIHGSAEICGGANVGGNNNVLSGKWIACPPGIQGPRTYISISGPTSMHFDGMDFTISGNSLEAVFPFYRYPDDAFSGYSHKDIELYTSMLIPRLIELYNLTKDRCHPPDEVMEAI